MRGVTAGADEILLEAIGPCGSHSALHYLEIPGTVGFSLFSQLPRHKNTAQPANRGTQTADSAVSRCRDRCQCTLEAEAGTSGGTDASLTHLKISQLPESDFHGKVASHAWLEGVVFKVI